jgi:capsular polysaccharide biosynthesis protein
MPDPFNFLSRWWKPIAGLTLLCMITAAIISLFLPKQYLSVATSVPASSFATDKSRIFNANIQSLYTALGTADDLDMILGTAELDTVYFSVARHANLVTHYKINETGNAAESKAASILKSHTKVMKSGYGELKVKVWDRESEAAARLANLVMVTLDNIHRELQSAGNAGTLEALKIARQNAKDSAGSPASYDQLITQYELLVNSKPHVLVPVESAKPASGPDKPNLKKNMILAAGLGLLFGILLALLLEHRKSNSVA